MKNKKYVLKVDLSNFVVKMGCRSVSALSRKTGYSRSAIYTMDKRGYYSPTFVELVKELVGKELANEIFEEKE